MQTKLRDKTEVGMQIKLRDKTEVGMQKKLRWLCTQK